MALSAYSQHQKAKSIFFCLSTAEALSRVDCRLPTKGAAHSRLTVSSQNALKWSQFFFLSVIFIRITTQTEREIKL